MKGNTLRNEREEDGSEFEEQTDVFICEQNESEALPFLALLRNDGSGQQVFVQV